MGRLLTTKELEKIMKKIFRTVAALAVVMFAGCTQDLENEVVAPGVDAGKTTVTVGIADTKTYLGELVDGARKVYWHNGDQIAINGVASSSITLNEEKTQAVFSFDDATLEHPYNVLYPASMYKDAQTITLPAVQNGATNNFAKDVAPMASYQAAEGTVQMHHLAGVIRLQVSLPADSKHTNHPLNKVETKGNAGEQMSGDFAIDYEAVTLTATSTADADKVVTTKAHKGLAAGETDDVFIVVPAREYPQGITVRLIDDAGHYMDIASKAITIEAGEIKAMPVVEFKPTGTLVGVEIASAEELIAFANAYNAGEYEEVNPLVVNLTQDIVFDDATNAAWTPIGVKATVEGEDDNYFNGYFNGAGFAIKNWNSTRPLFAYTNTDGTIENLTIDASCTLTANFADEEQYYAAFVGYHRGLLINCHVNANLTASGDWGNAEPHVGALVGRVVVGTVENCTVNGDVTITKTLVTNGKTSYYGGAVARISNADGVVKGVSVSGNVSHSAGSTYIAEGSENKSDAYVKYGGIVGLSAGTVSDCHLTDATKKFFYGNFDYAVDKTATTENHYRTQSLGGIVGEVAEGGSVSDCTNKAAVVFNQYSGNGDVSRYIYGGGIVGMAYGAVSNCTMYADLTNRSSCLQQFIGGIVGNVQAKGSVSNCANEGASIAAGTAGNSYYQARNNNIGGVIGVTYSTALSNLTNKAELVCSRMNSKDSATLSMGGIIGKVETTSGEIDGAGTIVNYGTVYSNHGQYNNKYTAIGGVIGEAKCSVKGVVNEGQAYYTIGEDGAIYKHIWVGGVVGYANGELTITSAENKGGVYINISKSVDKQHFDLCVGGVLGTNADDKAVALVNCVNSGSAAIKGGGTNTVGRSVAIGGIAGALTNGASSISGCTNTGALGCWASNNTYGAWAIRVAGGANSIGGIAGYIEGADGDLLSITNCTNNRLTGTDDGVGNTGSAIYAVRGALGGLVGAAKYADIKNSNCTTDTYNTNSTGVGGFVCSLTNSNIENCTLSNSVLQPRNGGKACGGCVAYVIASSFKGNTLINVTFTSSNGTALANYNGVLAGIADANSSFTDNEVSGTFYGAAITLDTKMIGSGSPAVTGTTLYTE